MPDAARWKPLFWIAAFYNLSAAGIALVAPEFHVSEFFGSAEVLSGPVARAYLATFWSSAGLFGVGYAIVALDPTRNHAILWLAVVGKTHVCWVFTQGWLSGEMTTFALVGGIGDLLFAAAFVVFLLRFRGVSSG